jgi:hypothetical protein
MCCPNHPLLRMLSIFLLSLPHPGEHFRARPVNFANAPSQASDNYYYDEWKKASEKFTLAQKGSLFTALGLAIGFPGALKVACECIANRSAGPCRRAAAPRITALASSGAETQRFYHARRNPGTTHKPSGYACSQCSRRSPAASSPPVDPAPGRGRSPDRSSRR